MAEYEGIIERLSKATGPDREIDRAILAAFGFSWRGMNYWHHDDKTMWPNSVSTNFTASLDAAIALVERVLPGWTIANIGQDDRKGWHAELREGFQTSYSTVKLGGAPMPATALLLALFRALQAKEGKSG